MTDLQPPSPEFLAGKGRVCTLGMFIIDHFEVRDQGGRPLPIDEEAIGGGGAHAMTAARLFLPPSHCGFLIDEGDDFPKTFKDELTAFGTEMIWFRKRQGKTTRALNIYSGQSIGEGLQTFQYLSPQLHLSLKDLITPPSPFTNPHPPEWVHIVVRIPRAQFLVEEMIRIERDGVGDQKYGKGWKAKMIWEPLDIKPEGVEEQLSTWIDLAPNFAAISPNLIELQTILSIQPSSSPTHQDVEIAAKTFHEKLKSRYTRKSDIPVIILRAGAMGSYTISERWIGWVPAFWKKEEQEQVVDPTGGGNAFLGGLCAGLLASDGDWRTACIYASTAASFAIQQRGLPRRTSQTTWNSDDPWRRLKDMANRVDELEQHQHST